MSIRTVSFGTTDSPATSLETKKYPKNPGLTMFPRYDTEKFDKTREIHKQLKELNEKYKNGEIGKLEYNVEKFKLNNELILLYTKNDCTA